MSSDFDIHLNRFENGFDNNNNIETLNPVIDINAENEKILPLSFQNAEKPVLLRDDIDDVPSIVPDVPNLQEEEEDQRALHDL